MTSTLELDDDERVKRTTYPQIDLLTVARGDDANIKSVTKGSSLSFSQT